MPVSYTHLDVYKRQPYASPTDMGVNMVGFAITDDEAAKEASKQEIIRRYYQTVLDFKNERVDVYKRQVYHERLLEIGKSKL